MPLIQQHYQSIAEAEQLKKEDMQNIVLSALSKAGFFEEAAFYGGTCLHLIYGLERFSEDMDFSLLKKDLSFSLEKYFPAIKQEFELHGKHVEIKKKDRQTFGKVQSAFLKDNTDTYDLRFQTEKTPKIKIETDYLPPLNFTTEIKSTTGPIKSAIRTFTPDCLFAGKMHALLFRQWQTRVKGRDWYDFAWYVKNEIPLNLGHLQTRIKEFNGMYMSADEILNLLDKKINSLKINFAKADVCPFLKNKSEIDVWCVDYFLHLSKQIKIINNSLDNKEKSIISPKPRVQKASNETIWQPPKKGIRR